MEFSRSSSGILAAGLPRLASSLGGAGPAWVCVGSGLLLTLLGVYAIDIATSGPGGEALALSGTAMRQIAYAAIGLVGAVLVAIPNHRIFGYASWVIYAIAVALLIFLLIPGVPTSIVRPRSGARGWIDLGPINFQPAEFAKLAYVLLLAWYLRFRNSHRTFLGLAGPAIITAIPVGLITVEPDLGSASLFIPTLFAMLLAAGARVRHLLLVVIVAAMAAPAMYPMLRPHQQQRFIGLVKQFRGDRSADQDLNMQSVTAQRVIAAGGLLGLPEARSRTLVHFSALPERHNDMIFAVICNRFGAIGAVGVLGIYFVWIVGALLAAARCKEPFGRLIIVGASGFMCAQVVVNVGMNLGVLPIVGIALPFVTHGGSGMVGFWAMNGLIVGIAMRQPLYSGRRALEWAD